jgi:hypothetical protein
MHERHETRNAEQQPSHPKEPNNRHKVKRCTRQHRDILNSSSLPLLSNVGAVLASLTRRVSGLRATGNRPIPTAAHGLQFALPQVAAFFPRTNCRTVGPRCRNRHIWPVIHTEAAQGSRYAARSRGDAMCPVCLASMGLMIAGAATSAGGLTALAVKLSRKKTDAKEILNPNERSIQNVYANSR